MALEAPLARNFPLTVTSSGGGPGWSASASARETDAPASDATLINPTANTGLIVIDVASDSGYRTAGSEDAPIKTRLELLLRGANGVFMYPAFNNEDVGIHAMGFSQKWVDIQQEQNST